MARQAQHRHLQSLGALARVVLFPVGPLLRRARVGPAPSSLVSGAFARMVLLFTGAFARMVLMRGLFARMVLLLPGGPLLHRARLAGPAPTPPVTGAFARMM